MKYATNHVTKSLAQFIILLYLASCITSCISYAGMEDGRSNGKGVISASGTLNYTNRITLREPEQDFVSRVVNSVVSLGAIYPEFIGRYGLTDNFDLGIKYNKLGEIGLTSKFQLSGTKTSGSAISSGADFNIGAYGNSLAIPFYLSRHSKNHSSAYFNPRLIFINPNNSAGKLVHSQGFNCGILKGEDKKFGFDVGFFHASSQGKSTVSFNIGFGLIYFIK